MPRPVSPPSCGRLYPFLASVLRLMSSAKTRLAAKTPATNESIVDMVEDPPGCGAIEVVEPVVEAPVGEVTEPDETVCDFELLPVAVEEVVVVVVRDVTRREKVPELPPLFESPQ